MFDKVNIIKCINTSKGLKTEEFIKLIELLAYGNLNKCSPTGISGLKSLDEQMVGKDDELTEMFLLDAISILSKNNRDTVPVVSSLAYMTAKTRGITNVNRVSFEEMKSIMYCKSDELPIESSKEKFEEVSEKKEYAKSTKEEDVKEDSLNDRDSYKSMFKRSNEDKKLLNFYSAYCTGVISELFKRYTGLFSSGYEVSKPTGILSERGILRLSGSKLVVDFPTASTTQLYRIFKDRFLFKEEEVRSVNNIADKICSEFLSGGSMLYFPNKMLEFAYGRKAPGSRAESVNTYEVHSDATTWKSYSSSELSTSLNSLVEGCLLYYLHNFVEEDSYMEDSTIKTVSNLLNYLQMCMSMCLLLMDYKVLSGIPSILRIRVCDPNNCLGTEDLTSVILNKAFMGSTGDVPYTYAPRFESESFVKEYAHEFNHNISQAMPLFAYKAYKVLKEQGIPITWDNMVLGKFEDGSILRNGTHGVALKNNLTHHIDAGSRAGKGVMTLAVLGAGVASRKKIFYIERKPDMASLLKHISPDMFVINGACYESAHDNYGVFADQDSWVQRDKVPEEILNILSCGYSWLDLGDLFYMRALKLVMGIIMARGSGKFSDSNFGGNNGILLIVDEFKNFQESFSVIVRKMFKAVAPDTMWYKKEKDKAEKNGDDMNDLEAYYNKTGLYSVSYLNHLIEDLEYLSGKRDAGFASKEVELSDIFVIGQHIEHGMLPFEEYRNALVNGRYKQANIGVKQDSLNKLNISNQSFGYSMVSFKTADAFFGRNQDDGREVYLAQLNSNSKAYGRLDDKASNFAYLRTFSESTRKRIISGKISDNLQLADECVYFKPFLVLNDCTDEFTGPMYDRCAGKESEIWVSKEEIIADNPDDNNPSELNKGVGFENYLKYVGVDDYSKVLESGADIANYVVKELLGYDGNWFDFIVDLRPKWMFTIEDIVLASKGMQPKFKNPSKSPVLSEYYNFDSTLGEGKMSKDIEINTNGFMTDMVNGEDFSNMQNQDINLDNRLANVMGDNDYIDTNDEIPLWDDMVEPIKESLEENNNITLNESEIEETKARTNIDNSSVDEILNHIEALKNLGVDIEVGMNGWEATDPVSSKVIKDGFDSAPDTEFGEDLGRIDYNGDIESYDEMVSIVTKDILKKFGGIERIHSLKVIGGSIIINGYYYRCKVKDMFARNIPYDIRRDINSGNISKLFNYSSIHSMIHIRDLEFDSISFVYDYVSSALGYGNSISVDKFFNDFKSLQVLTVGKDKFTRSNHLEKIQGNDLFYMPKKAKIYADALEVKFGSFSNSAWDWTKRSWGNKNQKIYVRVAKGTVGTVGTVGSFVGKKSVSIGKKIPGVVKGFVSGAKDIFK